MALDLGGKFKTTATQGGTPVASDPYAEIMENCRTSKRDIEELMVIIDKLQSQGVEVHLIEQAKDVVERNMLFLRDSQVKLEAMGFASKDCVSAAKPEGIKSP